MTKREKNIAWFMTKPNATSEHYHSLLIIKYGELCTAIFEPKCTRPTWHYKHRSPEEQSGFIAGRKQGEDQQELIRERYRKEAQEKAEAMKPGAILCSSWGYEQTNIDFYKVIARKASSVVLVEIGQHRTYSGDMQGNCTPDESKVIGQPFTKRINRWGGVNLATYKYCQIWNGQPMGWSSYN